MMSKSQMGWGAVIVGVLMALTQFFGWSGNLHYLWAVLVLISGFMSIK